MAPSARRAVGTTKPAGSVFRFQRRTLEAGRMEEDPHVRSIFRIREGRARIRAPLQPSALRGVRGARGLPRGTPNTPVKERGAFQGGTTDFRRKVTNTGAHPHASSRRKFHEEASCSTVRCTSTEPAKPHYRDTTHAPTRTTGNGLAPANGSRMLDCRNATCKPDDGTARHENPESP
jgi:hypothetical protein